MHLSEGLHIGHLRSATVRRGPPRLQSVNLQVFFISEFRDLVRHAQLVLRRLISLKNTISKQLPNMPKEYIARLVMDRRHRSCAIVAKSGTVLGGITYRPFHAQVCPLTFAECAKILEDFSRPATSLYNQSSHACQVHFVKSGCDVNMLLLGTRSLSQSAMLSAEGHQ